MEKNLLYFLLGNVDMAKLTTQQLIEISNDPGFKKSLLSDLSEYEKFYNKIQELKKPSETIKDVSSLARISTKMTIIMQTFKDKGPAKMSHMLIDGFKMGINDANENIAKAQEAKERPEVIKLAEEYRQLLVESMEKYKKYI